MCVFNVYVCVCDVSYYTRPGVGMCGMLGDVNGDIPGALSLWTTAENDRSKRGGGGGQGEKREGRMEEGRRGGQQKKKGKDDG